MSTTATKVAVTAARGTAFWSFAEADATAREVKTSAGTLLLAIGDNQINTSEDQHLCFWDAAAPVVGTDAPEVILYLPAGEKVTFVPVRGIAFATAIRSAVKTQPGTGGTSSPTDPVSAVAYYT